MIGRTPRQPRLLDRYWNALRFGSGQPSRPPGLDPDLAQMAEVLARESAHIEPGDAFLNDLRRQLASQATSGAGRGWTMPALDPRARPLPVPDDTEEQDMSRPSSAPLDEPIDIRQRMAREWLKLAAAILVFVLIGTVLVLTFRDDDEPTPAIGPSGPTPTPTVEVTATSAAVVPAPTKPVATATAAASPTSALPEFGTIAATIPVGELPRHMAASDDALWVTNSADGTVSRIDLATNEVVATINVVPPGQAVTGVDGATQVDAIAVGGGAVWVTALNSAQLVRIDPATNEVVARTSLSSGVHELEYGGDALWGKGTFSNTILRIDPVTNTVVATIPVSGPGSFVYLNDALWVQTLNDVVKIDPATNTVVATVHYSDATSPAAGMIRAAGGSLWVTSLGIGPTLVQIDPASATVVNRVALPEGVEEVLIAGSSDALYACPCFETLDNMIWQLDPQTLEFTASLVVPHAYWIEFEASDLWSYDRSGGEVTRVNVAP
jgi:YVTN family beta-propeller protein